jgi:hypothetical protein
LWSYKDELPRPVNDYTDIFDGPDAELLDMLPDNLKEFIWAYEFIEANRPSLRLMKIPEGYRGDNEIVKYCMDHDLEKIRLALIEPGRCTKDDIFTILWGSGFNASLEMLNLIIDTAKGTPNEVIVWREVSIGVLSGMASSDLFSSEVIDRAIAHKKSLDESMTYWKPFEMIPEKLMTSLQHSPNKRIFKHLEMLNNIEVIDNDDIVK